MGGREGLVDTGEKGREAGAREVLVMGAREETLHHVSVPRGASEAAPVAMLSCVPPTAPAFLRASCAAVKTAETGYMQRRMMKALEDLSVQARLMMGRGAPECPLLHCHAP